VTDSLAAAPYEGLEPFELDELITLLEPVCRRLETTRTEQLATG